MPTLLAGYDFLSNIPTGGLVSGYRDGNFFTQPILEASLLTDSLSSPLIDGEEPSLIQNRPVKVIPITSIEGSTEHRGIFITDNISEIAANENYSIYTSPSHVSTSEVNVLVGRFLPYSISQVSSSQDSSMETSRDIGFRQIDIAQIDSLSTIIARQRVEVTSRIFNTSKVDDLSTESWIDNEIGKVSLPSSISTQQSFDVNSLNHDNTSLLTSIYSTAQSIWHTNTPIDLNFAITNLPTGQLAEATITGYDQLGRPNAATISIDDDANGVGWFIDSTPRDSSEFQGVGEYFQATPNSPASGKYDLLTAILHEMGHTLGFINGYSQFNQNIKGRQFYTDPTHSYTLSSDLSHLDNTLYPNDLLNTNLKPGIRKLPSAMDWAIINAIAGTGRLGEGGTGVTVPVGWALPTNQTQT